MRKRIAGLCVDYWPAESVKFRSPVVFVHGLWAGSQSWRPWANRLSNLGWECWAISWRGRTGERVSGPIFRVTFEGCVEDLRRVVQAAPFPPVLLGHGVGGLVALKAAERAKVCAIVSLSAPACGSSSEHQARALRLLRLKYFPLIFLRRPIRITEKDFARYWLASVPQDRHRSVLESLVPESPRLVELLLRPALGVGLGRARCPVLMLTGCEDKLVAVPPAREMAENLGAEIRTLPGHGHWMLDEEGWEGLVGDVHRWLVQTLGEEVLLADFSAQR